MSEHLPDGPRQKISNALKQAYEPIVEEPVPPTLKAMAERLEPPGTVHLGFLARMRQLIAEALKRKGS